MKNRCARLLGVLLGVMASASVLFAQNASSLRGQVVDEQGAVIAGARATLVAYPDKKRTATANANGEFTVPNVSPGNYALAVEFKGFQSHVDENLQLPAASAVEDRPDSGAAKGRNRVGSTRKARRFCRARSKPECDILDEKMIMDLLPDNEDELLEFFSRWLVRRPAVLAAGKTDRKSI